MSINNCILKTLNLKDKNIKFEENFVEERKIKGNRCLVYIGYLENNFECCPYCGCLGSMKKNGTKTSLIKVPKVSELNTYLQLKKQIYKCRDCNKKITAQTTEVEYRCRISNNTKYSIIKYSKEILSHVFMAKLHNVSNMTIQRVVNRIYDNKKLYKHYLPENICIDEFTAMKRIMAFNFCDAKTGKTIDVVLDRTLDNLIKYFKYYMLEAREKVKYVVMDMYKPYISLINEVFPNAKIIIDMFHIVQLISKSFNNTRIKIMKKDKVNYRKFKRYWRLLLKSRLELDCSYWKKYRCFKNLMTEVDVVNYLLEQNNELKETYYLYQNILYSLQRRDFDLFATIINENYNEISDYMITSLNTLREFEIHIKNTLQQPFSNGVIERNNNTCKLIKRIGYGFRNFLNFKARIMFATNVFRNNKRSTENSFSTP